VASIPTTTKKKPQSPVKIKMNGKVERTLFCARTGTVCLTVPWHRWTFRFAGRSSLLLILAVPKLSSSCASKEVPIRLNVDSMTDKSKTCFCCSHSKTLDKSRPCLWRIVLKLCREVKFTFLKNKRTVASNALDNIKWVAGLVFHQDWGTLPLLLVSANASSCDFNDSSLLLFVAR